MPSVGDFDTSEITQMLEKIADMSEKTVLDRDIKRTRKPWRRHQRQLPTDHLPVDAYAGESGSCRLPRELTLVRLRANGFPNAELSKECVCFGIYLKYKPFLSGLAGVFISF